MRLRQSRKIWKVGDGDRKANISFMTFQNENTLTLWLFLDSTKCLRQSSLASGYLADLKTFEGIFWGFLCAEFLNSGKNIWSKVKIQ